MRLDFDDTHIYDEAVGSTVTWDGAAVYRIDIGPGKIGFESRQARIALKEWSDVSVLDVACGFLSAGTR